MNGDLLLVRRPLLTWVALAGWLSISAAAVAATSPAPLDMDKATAEVKREYAKAHPEVQEFVLHTAKTFGNSGMSRMAGNDFGIDKAAWNKWWASGRGKSATTGPKAS